MQENRETSTQPKENRYQKIFPFIRLTSNGLSLTGKWKRGLVSFVFSRTTLIFLLIAVQFVFISSIWAYFGEMMTKYVYGGQALFVVIFLIYLINTDSDSSSKLSWMALIAGVPVFGTLFYFWTRVDTMHKRIRKRLDHMTEQSRGLLPQNILHLSSLQQASPESASLATYLYGCGNFPVCGDTDVTFFPSGEKKFEALIPELEKAEHFIFLEYFIIEEGYMWGKILEVLARKVRQGVEVRVMYDGTCSLNTLPTDYRRRLEDIGIKARVWAPLMPFITSTYDYRDHRKILVIDGKTAFTGGINFADEYMNKKERFGYWKDTAIMLKGDAVRSFTLMFLQMWTAASREEPEDFSQYLPVYSFPGTTEEEASHGFVIPYADSPLDGKRVGEMVYIDILNTARHYVYIMTPYLILDGELENALKFAAERGVDVRLILPGIPDKKLVYALAKGHYRALLNSGVRIFEFTPGFVHAKLFVSDDAKAVVGSINLDYRSLYHHFECAAYMYGTACVSDIHADYEETLKSCREVTLDTVRHMNPFTKLIGCLLKIFAPLL